MVGGNTFFISDTHFGHANCFKLFKWQNTCKPLRPFSSVEEMDETMIENWNKVVKPVDRVYHLGDVSMSRRFIKTIDKCNGRKVLIKGNHDIFKLKDYISYFDDIRAYKVYPKYNFICSHIPISANTFEGRWTHNVHGHLHSNLVGRLTNLNMCCVPIKEEGGWCVEDKYYIPDDRYLNVCVEHINYTPISFDEVLEKLGKEKLK